VENPDPVCIGEFLHSVDPKSRVAIPHAFRKAMRLVDGDKVVVARGPDCCIEVHTLDGWKRHVEDTMGGISLYDPQARRLRRTRLSRAHEVEVDSQGRILIPKNLKDVSGIADQAMVIGVGPFFEAWEPNRYQQYFGPADEQYDRDLIKLDGLKNRPRTEPPCEEARHADGDVPRAGDGR
jgi:MraZ protein